MLLIANAYSDRVQFRRANSSYSVIEVHFLSNLKRTVFSLFKFIREVLIDQLITKNVSKYFLYHEGAVSFRGRGWSGGAMVLDKLPVPGRPTIWITVGQGPTALAVGADGGCLDIFTLIYPFFPLSPSLWGMARYRLKYFSKGR